MQVAPVQRGPEPTTDRFVVVMHGHEPRVTPGQTLAVQADKPFTGLSSFGSSFLSKFEASQCNAKLLEVGGVQVECSCPFAWKRPVSSLDPIK
jgi:hypothetical protein